jgi:EmrB/QacA subfamily drug resistance transporter
MYLASMESTVVTTAMPTIITRLGGLEIYSWVFSIYLLTATVSIPVWGRLSDLYGRRRLYLIGIASFVAASALCGLAASMLQLILFRALQGIGAGALGPLALTVIGEIYTFDERAHMQAVFSGVFGFASITGPILGGFITDNLSWRWVFFINIPIGLLAGTLIGLYLVDSITDERENRAGIRRGILMALSLALFLLYLMEGSNDNNWLNWRLLALMLLSVMLFWLYVALERKSKHPFIPPKLFGSKTFLAASANGICIGMIFFGVLVFVPLFSQAVVGRSATGAGSVITPLLLTWVSFSIILGRLLRRVGFRKPVFCGMLLLIMGTLVLAELGSNPSRTSIVISMICIGAGLGLNALPMLMAVQCAVPRDLLGIATSATQFFRSIGGAIGVAIMGSRLSSSVTRAVQRNPDSEIARLLRNPQTLAQSGQAATADNAKILHDILYNALHSAFFVAFIFSLIAFLSAFLVPREIEKMLQESEVEVPPILE